MITLYSSGFTFQALQKCVLNVRDEERRYLFVSEKSIVALLLSPFNTEYMVNEKAMRRFFICEQVGRDLHIETIHDATCYALQCFIPYLLFVFD